MKTYDVQDILDRGYNLEPIKCRFCGSLEVSFYQYQYDANCAECGRWQIQDMED
jgi:ribosomal protein S27E